MNALQIKIIAFLSTAMLSFQTAAEPMAACRNAYLREVKVVGPGGTIIDPGGESAKAASRECEYEQAKDRKAFSAKYGGAGSTESTKPKTSDKPEPPPAKQTTTTPKATQAGGNQEGEGAGKGTKKNGGGGNSSGGGGNREVGGGKGTRGSVRTQ